MPLSAGLEPTSSPALELIRDMSRRNAISLATGQTAVGFMNTKPTLSGDNIVVDDMESLAKSVPVMPSEDAIMVGTAAVALSPDCQPNQARSTLASQAVSMLTSP